MSPLGALVDNLLNRVGEMLLTRELAALAQVVPVSDLVWTTHVRRRCGAYWMPGKAGLRRLYDAVYTPVPPYHNDVKNVSVEGDSAYIIRNGSLWASAPPPGRPVAHGSDVNPMRCIAAIDEHTVAVGHDYGVYVYTATTIDPIWLGVGVTDIAHVRDGSLWIRTSMGKAYRYDMHTEAITCIAQYSFCVSGPVGMLGSHRGTWPVKSSLTAQVTQIAQSEVQIAAWHVTGHVSIFCARTCAQLHLVDTGAHSGPPLSIVGDVLRIGGGVWVDGRIRGSCPRDHRATTRDGRYMYAFTLDGLLCVSVA